MANVLMVCAMQDTYTNILPKAENSQNHKYSCQINIWGKIFNLNWCQRNINKSNNTILFFPFKFVKVFKNYTILGCPRKSENDVHTLLCESNYVQPQRTICQCISKYIIFDSAILLFRIYLKATKNCIFKIGEFDHMWILPQ